MAVRIRLSRTGKKNQPSYRIVVADRQTKRDGKAIEVLGFYQPLTNPATVKIDRARFDYWLSVGAQASDPVRRLILGQKRIRTKTKKEETEEKTAVEGKTPAPEKPATEAVSQNQETVIPEKINGQEPTTPINQTEKEETGKPTGAKS